MCVCVFFLDIPALSSAPPLPPPGDGPFFPRFQDSIRRRCDGFWWTELLYTINIFPWNPDEVCMGWTWCGPLSKARVRTPSADPNPRSHQSWDRKSPRKVLRGCRGQHPNGRFLPAAAVHADPAQQAPGIWACRPMHTRQALPCTVNQNPLPLGGGKPVLGPVRVVPYAWPATLVPRASANGHSAAT